MREMRWLWLPIGLCLGLATSLAAEDRSTAFLELMSRLPPTSFANRSELMPTFHDVETSRNVMAALAASGAEVRPDGWRVSGGPVSEMPMDVDWTGRVGFSFADVRAIAAIIDPPDKSIVLSLDPAAMPRIEPALLANAYAQSEEMGFPAFWRGKKDNSWDRDTEYRDDPFAFPVTKSSRIALDGEILLQSQSWSGLQAMVKTTELSPTLAALGKVLDLPDWGERRLVQATIFSDPMLFSPGFLMDKDLNPFEPRAGVVPYWSNFLLADLSDGQSDLTLVILLYSAKADAEAAVKALDATFAAFVLPSSTGGSLGEMIGPGQAIVTGEGPYAAVYAMESSPEIKMPAVARNRGYNLLLEAIWSRELTILGPASL